MTTTTIKLFMMSHRIPAKIGNPDAMKFYRTVARNHGYSLVRSAYGWVMV